MDSVDEYTLHPKTAEYTFYSGANGAFSMIYHMLGHKTHLHKLKKSVIISSILFDHNGMKAQISYKKITEQPDRSLNKKKFKKRERQIKTKI